MLFDVQGVNGTRYCEWIVNVYDCEDSEFFLNLLLFSTATCFFGVLLLSISAVTRAFGLKAGLMSFITGNNQPFFVFMISTTLYFVHSLLVVSNLNAIAIYVIWSLLSPTMLMGPVLFIDILKQGLSKNAIPSNETELRTCTFSDQHRKPMFFALTLVCLVINLSLITTAAILAYNNPEATPDPIVQQLVTSALTINVIIHLVFEILYMFVCRAMIRLLENALNLIDVIHDQHNAKPLRMTLQKIKMLFWQSIFGTITAFLYHLMLAFYDDFFINLYCSKALAVICVGFMPATLVPLGLFFFTHDVRRWLHKKKVESNSGTNNQSLEKSISDARVHSASIKQASSKGGEEGRTEINLHIDLESKE